MTSRVEDFLYSHHLSNWKSDDVVKRNNMLITVGTDSKYVFQNLSTDLALKDWFPKNC